MQLRRYEDIKKGKKIKIDHLIKYHDDDLNKEIKNAGEKFEQFKVHRYNHDYKK